MKSTTPINPDKKTPRSWQDWLSGSLVLVISILLHLLFCLVATAMIIQRYHEKRKQNFTSLSVTPSATSQSLEHNVELNKKKNAMSPSDVNQRIVTNGPSEIVLPEVDLPTDADMPINPNQMDAVTPSKSIAENRTKPEEMKLDMSAIAEAFFGINHADGKGLGLLGRYYHVSEFRDHSPSGVSADQQSPTSYYETMISYLQRGMPDTFFDKYYRGENVLYLNQFSIPFVNIEEAAKAFNSKGSDPYLWVAIYKGKFVVPRSGTYRFVGCGDDICVASVNGKEVFEAITNGSAGRFHEATEAYHYNIPNAGEQYKKGARFPCGDWMNLKKNIVYEIKILIGDDVGTSAFWMMVEQKNHSYPSSDGGAPILPLLRFSPGNQPKIKGAVPPYDNNTYMGWRIVDDSCQTGSTYNIAEDKDLDAQDQ